MINDNINKVIFLLKGKISDTLHEEISDLLDSVTILNDAKTTEIIRLNELTTEENTSEANLNIKRVSFSCLGWRYNPMKGTEICTKKDKCKLYDKDNYDNVINFKGINDFRNCLLFENCN